MTAPRPDNKPVLDAEARERLERAGFRLADAEDFLGLSEEERRQVEQRTTRPDDPSLPWFRRPVEALDLGPVCAKLRAAGLGTVGAVSVYLEKDADLAGVAGLSPEEAVGVQAAVERMKPPSPFGDGSTTEEKE